MRVTQNMSVQNMIYRMAQQKERLYQAEIKAASGKTVNDPSDDPAAYAQILSDRAEISQIGQYLSNSTQLTTRIEASELVLESVYDLLGEAEDIALDQSAGELGTKELAIIELQAIYDQILALANEEYGDGYMYSGNQTHTKPFTNEVSVAGGIAESPVFNLAEDADSITVEIADREGNVVRTITAGSGSEGENTVVWDGLDDLGHPVADGGYTFTVLAVDTSGEAVGSYPAYGGEDESVCVYVGDNDVLTINNDGSVVFTDALKAMSKILATIESANSAAALSADVDELDGAIELMKNHIVDLTASYSRLDTAGERLEHLSQTVEAHMTELESTDDEAAVVEMQARETAYEKTVNIASEILKLPSLMDMI